MATWPTLFTFGTLAGTPLQGDIGNAAFSNPPMTVTLTQDYLMTAAPGSMLRPFQTSPSNQGKDVLPQTFASGTTLRLHYPEATALIAADAAVLVSVG
jgi:hypothetical protein